jgi:hypothetical protein
MAADPFNSLGGYTVGIPPITIVDANGNVVANSLVVTNNLSANTATFSGNITATNFVGTLQGNVTGNIVIPGANSGVVFNSNGLANSDSRFMFDSANNKVTVEGALIANSVTMGAGPLEFCTTKVVFATTMSNSLHQVLHRTDANTISSIDYTVIATDTVGNNRQICKLFAGILGDEVEYYEYGSIDVPMLGPGVGDFRVQYDSPNNDVVLTVTPVATTQVRYKIMTTSYKE